MNIDHMYLFDCLTCKPLPPPLEAKTYFYKEIKLVSFSHPFARERERIIPRKILMISHLPLVNFTKVHCLTRSSPQCFFYFIFMMGIEPRMSESTTHPKPPGLPYNWFWQVGSVVRRFYCLKRVQMTLL